jgi:hypothetical protein
MVYIDESLNEDEASRLIDNQLIDVLILKKSKFDVIKENIKTNFDSLMKIIYYYNTPQGKYKTNNDK